jgi:hypothetical protein
MIRKLIPSTAALLLLAAPAAAQPGAGAGDVAAGDEYPAAADANAEVPGFVPPLDPPAFALGGFVDVGFADATGNGTSFHADDDRLPIDYVADAFATAVNSRGEVASIDSEGRFTNGFLPRATNIGGQPSFLLNTLALEARRTAAGDALLFFARVELLPRLDRTGNQTRVVVEQAFGRVQPFGNHELMLFVGKFDSVFGIEYLDNPAPVRIGITPSLLARYTTGTSTGIKALYRVPIAALASAASLNVAATNSGPFVEALQSPDRSLTGFPVISARLGWELNLRAFQLKLGGSGSYGPRNDQPSDDARTKALAADARATFFGISLAGEYLHLDEDAGRTWRKLTGAGTQTLASAFRVRGFWTQLTVAVPYATAFFRRTFVYARAEERRGWFSGFAHVRTQRLTAGLRLDLGDSIALKIETLFNREREGAPDVDNDVRCASLVWQF